LSKLAPPIPALDSGAKAHKGIPVSKYPSLKSLAIYARNLLTLIARLRAINEWREKN
jgi:hypothetical protein